MSEPRTVADLLDLGERVMADSSHIFDDHDNRTEAEELLAVCLDVDSDELDDLEVPPRRVRERFLSLVARRAGGEPLPFLTGFIDFYGLHLKVKPGAFVPRPSSELTVDLALKRLRRKKGPTVIDVCTGAGPIALAIADEIEDAEVWGADISKEGLAQGRENARDLGIKNVHFRRGDMYDALPSKLKGQVDLVTGHVPYVPLNEIEDLPAEVREFEPIYTLSDELSPDGMGLMRIAISDAPGWLRPRGWLLLEVSEDMGTRIKRMVKKAGFEDIKLHTDNDGLSVVIEGRKPR